MTLLADADLLHWHSGMMVAVKMCGCNFVLDMAVRRYSS